MVKRGFKIFVFLGLAMILLGLIFSLFDKKAYLPDVISQSGEEGFIGGWVITTMGSVMLLIGLLLKWATKKQDKRIDESPEIARPLAEGDFIVNQRETD